MVSEGWNDECLLNNFWVEHMEMQFQFGLTALIAAMAFVGVGLKIRQLVMSRKAQKWPAVEGIIESGQMEQVAGGGKMPPVILPVFAFSYHVGDEYYGGRFALLPYITDPTVADQSFLEHMIGRTVHVNYNPARPEAWFVSDELIDGCRVEQKFGRNLVNVAPSDVEARSLPIHLCEISSSSRSKSSG